MAGTGGYTRPALALVYFGTSAGLYTLGIWSPQIIRSFGASSLEIGFLNAFPAVIGVIAMILWARHSDRTKERSWHVIGACLLAAAGLIYAGNVSTLFTVMLALTLVTVGISASKPLCGACQPCSSAAGCGRWHCRYQLHRQPRRFRRPDDDWRDPRANR